MRPWRSSSTWSAKYPRWLARRFAPRTGGESRVDAQQINKLIARLQDIAERPAMYVGSHDIEQVVVFLNGFMTAVWAAHEQFDRHEIYGRVAERRGWTRPVAKHPYHEMV